MLVKDEVNMRKVNVRNLLRQGKGGGGGGTSGQSLAHWDIRCKYRSVDLIFLSLFQFLFPNPQISACFLSAFSFPSHPLTARNSLEGQAWMTG